MIKTKFSDFTKEEKEYAIKLLNAHKPMPDIRKKTRLSHNEILALIVKYNLPYTIDQLPVLSINDEKVIITSDNHKGNRYENKRYEKLIQYYARRNNIKTIINCGDELQSDIDPFVYGINGQTKAYLSAYPGKNITTIFLAGNHEYNAIEKDPEVYDILKSRKDIKFLGLGSAYILWQGHLVFLHHTISKFDLKIPYAPTSIKISGHHHFFKITKDKNIYAPTSSDDIKRAGAIPGFLIGRMYNGKVSFELNGFGNFGKNVVENGVVLTRSII